MALARVRRVVLEDLDGHDLVGAPLPALGHLAESPSAKKLQDLILVVEGGVEDFVLDQLIISIAVSTSPPAFPPATRLADQQPTLV